MSDIEGVVPIVRRKNNVVLWHVCDSTNNLGANGSAPMMSRRHAKCPGRYTLLKEAQRTGLSSLIVDNCS